MTFISVGRRGGLEELPDGVVYFWEVDSQRGGGGGGGGGWDGGQGGWLFVVGW